VPSVLWYCWLGLATCKKTVACITYTVLVETLNPAQSINQCFKLAYCSHWVNFIQFSFIIFLHVTLFSVLLLWHSSYRHLTLFLSSFHWSNLSVLYYWQCKSSKNNQGGRRRGRSEGWWGMESLSGEPCPHRKLSLGVGLIFSKIMDVITSKRAASSPAPS